MSVNNLAKQTINTNLKDVATKTTLRDDAFELNDREKIEAIEYHFKKIMQTLGLNLDDKNLSETPERVAKMYVKEIFSGLKPENKPDITLFENDYGYEKMLVEKDITVHSNCEHHFVPIIGKAHVAYIPDGQVIGLSKINRLVQYYARRPQVQERLTTQIADAMKEALGHDDVAVLIKADHMCMASRGINDTNSETITASYSGQFEEDATKQEFLSYITFISF